MCACNDSPYPVDGGLRLRLISKQHYVHDGHANQRADLVSLSRGTTAHAQRTARQAHTRNNMTPTFDTGHPYKAYGCSLR